MSLEKYRKEIDAIDKKLLQLFEKRFNVSKKVGEYKKKNKMKIFDKKREKEIIEKRTNETKLSSLFVKKLYKLIFKESKRLQK